MTDFKVMLAKGYDPDRVEDWGSMYVEPKLDGVRVVVVVDGGTHDASYYSRNGRELKMLGHIDDEVIWLAARLHKLNKGYHGAMFDGELVSATGNFQDISGVIHRKDVTEECLNARLHLFHAMPYASFKDSIDTQPQLYRSDCLKEALSYKAYELLSYNDPVKVDNDKQVQRMYKKHRARGYEGSMVKDMMKPWEAKRSFTWMKMKAEETADVKVIKVEGGSGKYKKTTGSLLCLHKKKEISVSGMSDEQRHEFWAAPDKIVGKMIEVQYQEETNAGALRHPRFMRLRPDKD